MMKMMIVELTQTLIAKDLNSSYRNMTKQFKRDGRVLGERRMIFQSFSVVLSPIHKIETSPSVEERKCFAYTGSLKGFYRRGGNLGQGGKV